MPTEKRGSWRPWAALLPMLVSLGVHAQTADTDAEAPDAEPASDAVTLENIEVTAQRRVQRLQDVPGAVSALSRDQIEMRGVDGIDNLNAVVPGLQISKTPSNSTISQVSIRGVTQINPAIYWDPAVGIYVDGVYIGKAQGSIFDIVDLSRIEVLRGPQGTLYGRNTLAGAINLVTRSPSGVFGGTASLEIGDYNAFVQRANVDLPRMGIVSVSLGARSERRDGWVDTTRTSSRNELNDRHNDGFRLAADFDFGAGVLGEYRFDHSNVNQSNNYTQLYRISAEGAFAPDAPFGALPSFASQDRETTANVDAPSFERSEVQGHSFTLSWDLDGNHTLKSISGYRRLDWNDSLDLDGSPLPVAFTQRHTDYDQWSEDLQLIGQTGAWNYVGGLYYFGDDGQTNNPQLFFGGGADFDSRYATKTSAWAAYGQVDFAATDALTLSAGLRYTREKKELDRAFGVRQSPTDPYFYLIPEGTHAEDTFSDTTPTVSIAYRLNADVNLYARYAEGFKSGGFNGEFSDPNATPEANIAETRTPFKPERQRSFEIGAKTRFGGGRGQFNVAVFQNDLKDLQASIFLGSGAAATVIRNAGEATVRGVELELALIVVEGTQLRANYAYLDPEYDKFIDAGVNQADNRAFVHAPENTFNLVLDSELMRRDWGALRAMVDYAYTDAFFTYPYQLASSGPDYNPNAQIAANSEVDAHGILNLRLAVADVPLGERGTGELALWCRNALDDDTATNFIDFGPGFSNLTVANFEDPRTFGITGIVRW
ncbi:MAG: TonB-dependent receptor [Nevskiales bacterium]|nr:TonB-dependent receptor [Nevskiales bacterium]